MNRHDNRTFIQRYAEQIWTILTILIILAVTCFPYRMPGLYGYEPDILYHLNRLCKKE